MNLILDIIIGASAALSIYFFIQFIISLFKELFVYRNPWSIISANNTINNLARASGPKTPHSKKSCGGAVISGNDIDLSSIDSNTSFIATSKSNPDAKTYVFIPQSRVYGLGYFS